MSTNYYITNAVKRFIIYILIICEQLIAIPHLKEKMINMATTFSIQFLSTSRWHEIEWNAANQTDQSGWAPSFMPIYGNVSEYAEWGGRIHLARHEGRTHH